MGSPLVIISAVGGQRAAERAFAEDEDVVQALPPNRADDSFPVGSLPRRARSRQDLFDAHGLDLRYKFVAEDAIAVAQQITRCRVPRKGLPELLSRPFGCRMGGDAKMQNASPVVGQHEEDVQNLKPD